MRSIPFLFLTVIAVAASGAGAEVPTSARARKAIAKVSPALRSALAGMGTKPGDPIFIRIFKEEKELELWVRNGERFDLFRTYPICTFSGGPGPKLRQGDLQSPEGFYFVTPQRLNPSSRFHLSFNLGYPNAYDRAHGRTGSALMVHGDCVSIGCYAMTDGKIEEIYTLADAALRGGQPFFRVHVFPFRMSGERLEAESASRWHGFWNNLAEGYDHFERTGKPPDVTVRDKRYVFEEEE